MNFNFDEFDWVTSDTHFGHSRIVELCYRPFDTVEAMDSALVANWNRVVKPEDNVLHLGDLALGTLVDSLELTKALNGNKFLVPGNHDRVASFNPKREKFLKLYEDAGWTLLPEILEGTRGGIPLVASHYPYHGDSHEDDRYTEIRPKDAGVPIIHGHTHNHVALTQERHFHVGVDSSAYYPLPFAFIDEWLKGGANEAI